METYQIDQRQLTECHTAVVRSTVTVSDMGGFVGPAIGTVARALAQQRVAPSGPPFARYHRTGGQEFDVEAGFATPGEVSASGDVRASTLPGGAAAVLTYLGPYDEMEPAYGALEEWVARSGGRPSGDPWEVYLSDPSKEPDPRTWRTEIVMPFQR
ncbi:MAG TPA: GyrI-like domain-containing protein [Propionibacteriaceae bacterium]|nr:GyrI-like domain-containing protein [Propionibacteriaceae bacterium]